MSHLSKNEQRFATFRERLAKGFYIVDPESGETVEDEGVHQKALDSTKPWRNELWKAFNQLERDVSPMAQHRYDLKRKGKV